MRRVRRVERQRRRLLCFPRPDGAAGGGEAREGREPAGAPSAWGQRRAGTLARGSCLRPALRCLGAVLASVAGSGAVGMVVRPLQGGRTCGGAQAASPPRPDGKAPLSGLIFVRSPGRAEALRRVPGGVSFRFSSGSGHSIHSGRDPRARRGSRNSGGRGRVFQQPGRVKFENRLQAKKAWEAEPAAALEGRLSCL